MTTPSQIARAAGFGSLEEQLVFNELLRRGYREGIDFTYQSKVLGGRVDKGGFVVDFLFSNPPDLAINPLGEFFHYAHGVDQRTHDLLSRIVLLQQGITLIFIDNQDIHRDVRYYVGEALQYRDHSSYSTGKV